MRRSRSKCTHEGCIIAARAGGVCQRHGAKAKKCSHTGCTNGAQAGGVCYRHGAKQKKCSHEGCTKLSQSIGVCHTHVTDIQVESVSDIVPKQTHFFQQFKI